MEQLVRLWQMWASGSDDPEVWKQVADVSGLPLYSRPARIASRPAHTAIGALLGLIASIAGVWTAGTGALQPGWLEAVLLVVAIALALLVVGRFLPNVVSGFTLVGIAGSIVSSIVSFSQGYATGGFLWLLMAVVMLSVRIFLPRVAQSPSHL